jgi:methylmalonyl-CoA mutase cobalamin-binding subunit
LIVIIEVFIAQGQPLNALRQQLLHAVFDVTGVAVVNKTVRQSPDQAAVAFQFAQDQATPITGEVTTPEVDLYFALA